VTASAPAQAAALDARARQSRGSSEEAIYRMVERALEARGIAGGRLVDVGCGGAALWRRLGSRFSAYCGLDAVRYHDFPDAGEFHQVDLDARPWPIPSAGADVAVAVETIEHLENPWAFMRTLADLVRPGGWVIATTPNQLSALSLATLIVRRRFSAFQDVHYPAHRTALLEVDLRRAALECGLEAVEVVYSERGRILFTPWHFPSALSRRFARLLSDNLLIVGRRPLL
jgi:2-polyprenyl-3-methyl-5-hydroxy-6-metoxy-1,4-benzoquinol methylase